jgi:NAD(P)H-dependent FMN reductase
MAEPLQLLAISGSLRAAASNTAVLVALAAIDPAVRIVLYQQLAELPHFNPDLDREGEPPPPVVGALRAQVGRADGLLISSPEYAHGVPGSLKNALDWLVGSLEFPGKPVALVNIAPRSTFVHAALGETLRTMSATLVAAPALTLALPRSRMTAADMLADPAVAPALRAALAAFTSAIRSAHPELQSPR